MSTYHAVKAADKIITISHNSKQDILNHYSVDEKKIKVIYLGCDEIFHSLLESLISLLAVSGSYQLSTRLCPKLRFSPSPHHVRTDQKIL